MPNAGYRFFCMAALLLGVHTAGVTGTGDEDGIVVSARKENGKVVVDVSMSVPATRRETWEVLTDYDHMAEYFPKLTSSKVIERNGNRVRIEQEGRISYGPLSFPFQSVREIDLVPYEEIRSRAAGGSLKSGDALTRLAAEPGGTRILYHSESVPNVWVPPGIGPKFIERGTREQFESLRAEILKRKRAEKPSR